MRWLSKETRKEDTEVQDNTELGREFQRATVDGRKDCNLRCVLQRGIASVSLRKKVEDKLESGKLYIILVNVFVQQWEPFSSSTKQHQRLKDEATVTMQI